MTYTLPEWQFMSEMREHIDAELLGADLPPGALSIFDQYEALLTDVLTHSYPEFDLSNAEHCKALLCFFSLFYDVNALQVITECEAPADPIHHIERGVMLAAYVVGKRLRELESATPGA